MPCNFPQVVAYRGVAKLPQQLLGFTHMLTIGRRDLDEDRDHFNLVPALLAGDGRQIADQLCTRPDPRKIIITTRLTGSLSELARFVMPPLALNELSISWRAVNRHGRGADKSRRGHRLDRRRSSSLFDESGRRASVYHVRPTGTTNRGPT
jgi:hypothetical protein